MAESLEDKLWDNIWNMTGPDADEPFFAKIKVDDFIRTYKPGRVTKETLPYALDEACQKFLEGAGYKFTQPEEYSDFMLHRVFKGERDRDLGDLQKAFLHPSGADVVSIAKIFRDKLTSYKFNLALTGVGKNLARQDEGIQEEIYGRLADMFSRYDEDISIEQIRKDPGKAMSTLANVRRVIENSYGND